MKTQSLLVTTDNADDFKLLQQLLNKMGLSSVSLTEEEMEDLGLLSAMLKEPRAKYVSEKKVRKALGSK